MVRIGEDQVDAQRKFLVALPQRFHQRQAEAEDKNCSFPGNTRSLQGERHWYPAGNRLCIRGQCVDTQYDRSPFVGIRTTSPFSLGNQAGGRMSGGKDKICCVCHYRSCPGVDQKVTAYGVGIPTFRIEGDVCVQQGESYQRCRFCKTRGRSELQPWQDIDRSGRAMASSSTR